MEVQTRRSNGDLRFFATLKEAMADAEDKEVWKVSLSLPTGERIRLVRENGPGIIGKIWIYQNIMDEVHEALAQEQT